MTLRLRDLGPDDAPEVAALFARSRTASMPWLPVLHTAQEDREFFAGQLRDHVGVGADVAGELAGFAIARPGWLDHLFVAPYRRGAGIGSALVGAVRQRIPGDVQLWAFARNTAALGFYAHLGAVVVDQTDGAGNEEREPDVRLLLRADPTPPGSS